MSKFAFLIYAVQILFPLDPEVLFFREHKISSIYIMSID